MVLLYLLKKKGAGETMLGGRKINHLLIIPETNIAHENPMFPDKYHQNGGFSMAMLVSGSVIIPVLAKHAESKPLTLWPLDDN